MPTIKLDGRTVKYRATQKAKDELFAKALEFFTEHGAFSGESVCQSDEPQIAAPGLLAEIADEIFQFKTTWND